MAILSVGLIGAMRVFPMGLRASQRAELNSRAAIVAQRTIEMLKLKSWDELVPQETTGQDDGFSVTTRICEPVIEPLTDAERLKTVEVSITLMQDGRPRQLVFLTYVRRDTS